MNKENLQILATFLFHGDLPKDVEFDMESFTSWDAVKAASRTHCGTAGCTVGFAPFAGIKKRRGESWTDYSIRTLTGGDWWDTRWRWCFSGGWYWVDNTPKGAARRIQYLLNKGLDEWNGEYDEAAVALYKNIRVKK